MKIIFIRTLKSGLPVQSHPLHYPAVATYYLSDGLNNYIYKNFKMEAEGFKPSSQVSCVLIVQRVGLFFYDNLNRCMNNS